eukprot:GFYU01035574.1.p1 GENE.GFYU01035574.1~~GFYU01035574.1.p1  ORF type:complete len:184 (+),score=43.84 GFYU01035574.1:72-554(+)
MYEGTTKLTSHIPGYTGFITTSKINKRARSQCVAGKTRPDLKAGALLFNLRQYPQTIPGYSGDVPQSAFNVKEDGPVFGDDSMSKRSYIKHPIKNSSVHGKSSAIRDEFYHTNCELVSEDGIKQSEKYFCLVRPMEGLPHIYRPPKFTESGYAYNLYEKF